MYQLTESSTVIRTTDNAFIPADSANRDYAEYLAWLNDGNAPEPYASSEPQPKGQFSVLDFRDRFTMSEQIAIRQAQITDMEVGLVYDSFISAQFIDITDPRVAGGIDLYISKGLLEPDRKESILAPELIPPPEAA